MFVHTSTIEALICGQDWIKMDFKGNIDLSFSIKLCSLKRSIILCCLIYFNVVKSSVNDDERQYWELLSLIDGVSKSST